MLFVVWNASLTINHLRLIDDDDDDDKDDKYD